MNSIASGTYNGQSVPIDAALAAEAAGWPWGTQILVTNDEGQFLLGVGPSIPCAAKWTLPVCAWHPAEGQDVNDTFHRFGTNVREELNLAARTSMSGQANAAPSETPPAPAGNTANDVQIFHSKLDAGAHAAFQLWRRAHFRES